MAQIGTPMLKIVELPDDTVPTAWAPEISAIASRDINEKTNYRLLADSVAHQMIRKLGKRFQQGTTGGSVDGGARASEIRYAQEHCTGAAAFQKCHPRHRRQAPWPMTPHRWLA